MENSSDGQSLDLLSAALNQSGLINCKNENSTNEKKGITTCIQEVKSVAPNKILASNPLTTAITPKPSGKTVVTPLKTSKQLVSIPRAKIIKLPTLATGSYIKINKHAQPTLIKVNNSTSNASLPKALTPSVPATAISSTASQLSNNGAKIGKVVAGGKAMFIPRVKTENPSTLPEKLVQPQIRPQLVSNTNYAVKKLQIKSASGNLTSKKTISVSTKPKITQASLNLGSMFVESAEKEVGSDFDTPPGSPFTVAVDQDNSNKVNKNTDDGFLTSSKTDKFRNGTANLRGALKLSSSQSIPTIRLSTNNKNSQDKAKILGTETLLRAMSLPLINKRIDEELLADDEKEEELQHAQTYSEYMPSKLQIGLPHPDSVVETSSLASITPPHVRYRLSLPRQVIETCQLSALQLESIVYACQKHETRLRGGERAGFLIGDGAGVGKGRSVAGIIYENYLVGRKRALWFSVSNDLKFDAERDLRDIGAKHIKVYSLNKFKYGKITSRNNGAVKKGVIFATYSSLIGESHSQAKYHTRLKQLLHWCGEDFDGPIIFDECHKAKNLLPSGSGKSTKTGVTVLELQNKLPNARVVYASATGASEPRNMAYMSRLGLWGPGTPFNDFVEFIQAVERRGVGAMELVAMDMKLRGCYIARQLSFYGVSFKIEEVALDSAFINMYNKSVRLWVAAREAFQVAAAMMEAEYHMKKSMWAQFWSAHQRFFKYLCLSAKVKHTVLLVREAVKHGKCVVIGLQSTGEAGTVDQLEKQGGELEDFVSTAKNVFENVIERHFPAPDRRRVVALLGRDFYKKPDLLVDANAEKKRKLDDDERDDSSSKRLRKNSDSNDNADSSPDDSSDDMVIISDEEDLNFTDSSSLSEEDIGKIFGDGSDSDDRESPVKKMKNKRCSNADEKSRDNEKGDESRDSVDDGGLKMKVKGDVEENPGLLSSLDLVSGTLTSALPGMGPVERAQALKKDLLNRLEVLGPFLPNNMLDELIESLGGTENVAEMTGRKGRVISTDEGSVQYQSRAEDDVPVELLNITEKQRFMDGEKNIAIISEAASSGISLQADKRVRNQRKRVHVTVELPWSADRAVQQFGRTHRSNQVNAPEYVFLITELAGEQRFASVVAKRLESLGALTHGDRRATESRDLSKFNYDNKYGRKALDTIMKAIAGYELPLVAPPTSYKGNFFKDVRQGLLGVGLLTRDTGQLNYQLDKDYNNIFKFMNRILGMEVEQQNAIFTFFSDTLAAIISEAKRLGEYDQGIMDVGVTNNLVERIKCRDFPLESGASVSLHSVRVERGTSWEEAKRLYRENSSSEDSGFYVTFQKKNDRHVVMLAIEFSSRRQRTLFLIHRPNTGKQTRRENLEEITKKYRRVEEEEAQSWWEDQYRASLDQCSHQYWQGSCSRGGAVSCHVGKRRRLYHVLSGSVLQVWKTVESILTSSGGFKYKMQIVRLRTSDGGKLVGLLIPSTCVTDLSAALSSSAHDLGDDPNFSPSSDYDVADQVAISDDDSDEYEEVDEIDPDAMLSSVLFSRKEFSWS